MGPNNSRGSDVSVRKSISTRVQKLVAKENKKRCSPRLEKIPASKRPFYGPSRNQPQTSDDKRIPASKRPYYGPSRNQQQPSNDTKIKKKSPTSCAFPLVATKLQQSLNMSGGSGNAVGGDNDGTGGDVGVGVGVGGVTSYVPHSKVDMAKVNDALKIYNKYYSQFSKEKEASKNVGNQLAKSPSSKREGVGEADGQQSLSRPDLRAISMMLKRKEVLYHEKRFGHLPGIDVNFQFGSRAEMVAIGLHGQWLNGIDYIGKSYRKKKKLKGYRFPIAVAIVLSGQYEDDQDNSENIEYTGQGGNDLKGSKHQIHDQKMAGGNLALKNCMEQSIPVRVIRGHTDGRDKTYTYDGLYKVSECWHAKGVSGFRVYKYRLKRLEGQPKLTSNQVHYNNGRSSRAPIKSPHLRLLDITEGQEEVNIPVMNAVDDTAITGFTYTKHNQVLSDLTLPPNATGCDCNGYCSDSKNCACAELNGGELPYVRIQGGRLIKPKDVVFECGPTCGCGPGCINRVSQRGLKYHLEIFRTSDRGWAVKTKDFIPCGAFVCEYIGELRRNSELNNVSENDYIFEIDCCHTMKGIDGREKRLGDVSVSVSKELENADENEPEFCIDAGCIGNVARFINHSCEPNLFVQCVLSAHRDPRFARITLFASDNILPMEELTYDYGYALDSVVDIDGNVKTLPCHCGTSECRKRLY